MKLISEKNIILNIIGENSTKLGFFFLVLKSISENIESKPISNMGSMKKSINEENT